MAQTQAKRGQVVRADTYSGNRSENMQDSTQPLDRGKHKQATKSIPKERMLSNSEVQKKRP